MVVQCVHRLLQVALAQHECQVPFRGAMGDGSWRDAIAAQRLEHLARDAGNVLNTFPHDRDNRTIVLHRNG